MPALTCCWCGWGLGCGCWWACGCCRYCRTDGATYCCCCCCCARTYAIQLTPFDKHIFSKFIILPAEQRHPSGGSVAPAAATRIGAAAGRPTRPARRWVWPRLVGRQLLVPLVRSIVASRTHQSAAGAGREQRLRPENRGPWLGERPVSSWWLYIRTKRGDLGCECLWMFTFKTC